MTFPKPKKRSRRRFIRAASFLALASVFSKIIYDYRASIRRRLTNFSRDHIAPRVRDRSPKTPFPRTAPLPNEASYSEFITNLNLRYISPHELISAHKRERNGVYNELPPKQMWNNIVPTLRAADELRGRLGCKLIRITSAYRSPDYNAQCPGASRKSYHMKNIALDLVYECSPLEAAREADKMRKEKCFRGGLGVYQSFIHIDTRGRNANWGISI